MKLIEMTKMGIQPKSQKGLGQIVVQHRRKFSVDVNLIRVIEEVDDDTRTEYAKQDVTFVPKCYVHLDRVVILVAESHDEIAGQVNAAYDVILNAAARK